MPIRRFLSDEGFDPERLREMNAALLGACRALGLKLKDDPAIRLLARRIIEMARDGERNPERLRAEAIKHFKR
jgi:urease gamma subunit